MSEQAADRAVAAPSAAERAALPQSALRAALWPAFWLGVACVGAKAVHWSLPAVEPRALRDYVVDVGVSGHQDALFAACVGACGSVWLRVLAGAPRARRAFYWLYLAFCLVCVAFSVASVQIFAFRRSPMTYALVYLADDLGMKRSRDSISALTTRCGDNSSPVGGSPAKSSVSSATRESSD